MTSCVLGSASRAALAAASDAAAGRMEEGLRQALETSFSSLGSGRAAAEARAHSRPEPMILMDI